MAPTVKQVEDELLSISMKLLAFTTVLSVVDVSSDFIQGYLLYQDPGLRKYGILTFVLNWLPGVVASIHLVTNHSRELGFEQTIKGCGKTSIIVQGTIKELFDFGVLISKNLF